jgi:hypothetical protein
MSKVFNNKELLKFDTISDEIHKLHDLDDIIEEGFKPKLFHPKMEEFIIFDGNNFINFKVYEKFKIDNPLNEAYQKFRQSLFDRTCVFVSAKGSNIIKNHYVFEASLVLKEFTFTKPFTIDLYRACKNIPFADEPILGYFSGFWISPNIVVTAKHTSSTTFDSDYHIRILSGFYNNTYKDKSISIPIQNVFEIEKDSKLDYNPDNLDVIFYKTTSNNNLPEESYKNGRAEIGDKIYSVGYPFGLPAKLCKVGEVRDQNEFYYFTDIDSLNKSSGSAIYNENGEIIGMLLGKGRSPEIKFCETDHCWQFNQVPYDQSKGDIATIIKVEHIINLFNSQTTKI